MKRDEIARDTPSVKFSLSGELALEDINVVIGAYF